MLISVHIPKTGGVTFRSLLEHNFKSGLLYDYQDRPMSSPTFLRNMKACRQAITPNASLSDYECVHGHFMPFKYKFLKEKRFSIWFRHPVDRIISRYYYMQRHSNFSSNQFDLYIRDKNISLEDFCEIRHFHNLYNKYLWGVSLECFDFIGITEKYEQSLKRFCNAFEIDADFRNMPSENINTDVAKEDGRYTVNDKLFNSIYRNNRKDFLIYEKALSMY
uniref:Sulfotransferase family protein n=1 Tax=uncultured Thiotrichaceae bacterium TaxID=298394 RepID=A0A6S6U5T1_9GAMM|nr:MAG: Sulfotransferase family protein [uncultured Thiotrichaceae bacterium]